MALGEVHGKILSKKNFHVEIRNAENAQATFGKSAILAKKACYSAEGKTGLLAFIAYKVGMKSAIVKDNTPDSLTKDKRIVVPVTLLECPPMKIFSIRKLRCLQK